MTTAVWTDRSHAVGTASLADTALESAARLWSVIAVLGQLVFAFSVAAYYASAAVRRNFEGWNRFMPHGYIPGAPVGNLVVAVHLLCAVFIVISGAIQLLPQVRRRAPALHRWNGRLYIVSAFAIASAGLYMLWARGGAGDLSQRLGATLNAALVILFAAMALRTALARDFRAHRPWALRLFLAVGGVWFIRVELALSFLVFKGPFGFDPRTFTGPFLTFLSFASYLVPLAVLEIYLRAQASSSRPRRLAVAGGLLGLTAATAAGIFAATLVFWLPRIRAAVDDRKPIAETLSATIDTEGVEAAVRRYRELKATQPAAYDFGERELNRLGYRLLRGKRLAEAIRVFELNVEAYPRSANVHDSLGEAWRGAGDADRAIASYRRSLELDPSNRGAVLALQELELSRARDGRAGRHP